MAINLTYVTCYVIVVSVVVVVAVVVVGPS